MRTLAALLALVLSGCATQSVASFPPLPAPAVVLDSGSMRPTLQGGELYTIEPIAIEDVRVGDIVVFRWESRGLNVIHRVVRISRAANGEIGLRTKGDANGFADSVAVTKRNLIGIAVF